MRSYIVWIIFVIPVMIFTGLWRLCEFLHFRVSGRLLHWFRKSDKKLEKLFRFCIGDKS